jgi:FkbM family methyltransferase
VVFLFAFDYNSVFARKNPVAAVEAFQQAFAGRPAEARLTIKSINGERHPADRERLRAAAAGDERITLIEDYLDAAGVRALFAGADCYLSLHRSEGFGLTVAEAMAHGLPAIATGYGGTAEFLTADIGWPIPYRLVPVGQGNPPYPADAVWAEPDLDAAARAMREVVDDPELAARRGEAARKHVLTTRASVTAAGWVRERLEQAYASWRTDAGTGSGGSRGPAPAAVSAVRSAREALRWRADAAAPSRLPLAPALRRAVLRGLDHYDQHQRGVLGALMDGVEQGLHRLSEQQAQLAARVDLADQRLAEAHAELAALAERSTDRAEQLHAALTALETGGAARLAEALAAERAAGEERLARVEQAAAAALQQRVAELDRKLVGLLAERDARLDGAEAAAADLRRELPALRTGLLRHHDLLSPPPDGALDWPPPDGPTDRPNRPTDGPSQPAGEPNQPTGEPNRRAGGPNERAGEATEVVPTDVGPLRLPAWDRVVLPWLRTYGRWEEHESRLLDALLPPGGGFVDIGAHVGYFTIRALRAVGASGAVCAVEPWAPARELLEANVAANVPAGVVRAALAVLPAAAWDAGGPLRLALSAAGNSGDNRVDDRGAVEVTGLRLDAVPELAHARRIDVVKSDAQGRDHRALAGAARLLAAHRPHVLCEFDPAAIADAGDDPAGVLRRYRSWGYHPLAVTARIVEAVEASGWRQVPLAVAESDDDLVAAAGSAPGGFLTLWLRPDDRAPTGTQGADGG